MLQQKIVVELYKNRDGQAPDESVEFTFASAAREYARNQIQGGKIRKAIVKDKDGRVIETLPS